MAAIINVEEWEPLTKLGRMVKEGKIASIDEIFQANLRIQEPEIVAYLLPDLRHEVLSVNYVQRQTDSGEVGQFQVVVAVGDEAGHIGLGIGKARQMRQARDKAYKNALLNMIPVRRGCGSWECSCNRPHSIPFTVWGKSGSVEIKIMPGPRGLGLVAGETAKRVLALAGIKDAWTKTRGRTRTTLNFAFATFNALKQTYKIRLLKSI